VDLAEMKYTIEGGYFDRFPYAPYVPPGTVRPASHNDRRVLGRLGDHLISVTDLPAHFLHPSDAPNYAYASQNFEFAGDFTTWILETCRRTRFTPAAASLPDLRPSHRCRDGHQDRARMGPHRQRLRR